jgi:hypothetical protein
MLIIFVSSVDVDMARCAIVEWEGGNVGGTKGLVAGGRDYMAVRQTGRLTWSVWSFVRSYVLYSKMWMSRWILIIHDVEHT